MKAKKPPATNRIAHILNDLAGFNFILYYVKGRDLLLTDFLSRTSTDYSDPHQLQYISFERRTILAALYKDNVNSYNISTRSTYKQEGIKPAEVHGANKSLNPHIKPEHQKPQQSPAPVQRQIPRPSVAQQVGKKILKKAIKQLQKPHRPAYNADTIDHIDTNDPSLTHRPHHKIESGQYLPQPMQYPAHSGQYPPQHVQYPTQTRPGQSNKGCTKGTMHSDFDDVRPSITPIQAPKPHLEDIGFDPLLDLEGPTPNT